MMASKMKKTWIAVWVLCGLWQSVMLERVLVDMSGRGCFDLEERRIKDDQVYSVYANYQPNVQPALDHCDVGIRAVESNRRLEYMIDKLTIFDCGVTIWLYDNPQLVSSPTRKITCNDDKKLPIQGKTSHGVFKISLRKESTQATAFEFQIHVKTDYGPPFDFEKASSSFYELPLDTGAIVGIVIAGSVVIIAVAGLAIYCCLKARMNNRQKDAEASDGLSAPSIYTTGSSGNFHKPSAGKHRSSQNGGGGGGFSRPASQDSEEMLSSKRKANINQNSVHAPHKNLHNGHLHYKEDAVHTHKDSNVHANKVYDKQEKLDRQASLRGSQKRRQHDVSYDDADHAKVKGGHISRRDSGKSNRVRYDKKTNYSRNDDYSSIGKSKKHPGNSRRARSRSPGSQGSIGSTVDSNTLVYGYSRTAGAYPVQDPDPRSRSRSRSRAGSQRSGSLTRSRTGSVGRSEGRGRSESRGRSDGRDGRRTAPKNSRQYGDMSDFLPEEQRHHNSRSHSGSVGRSYRR